MSSLPKPLPSPTVIPIAGTPGPIVPTGSAGAGTISSTPPATAGAPVSPTPTVSAGSGTASTASGSTTSASAVPITLTTSSPTYPTNASTPDAAKVSVTWDKSFANLQSLTFSLTVTDTLGATSTKTATVTIVPAPVAVLSAPQDVSAGSNIVLDGTGSTGVGLTHEWQLTQTTPITTSAATTGTGTTDVGATGTGTTGAGTPGTNTTS